MDIEQYALRLYISIHTLHTEGDWSLRPPFPQSLISIHTLHTEGDNRKILLLLHHLMYFNPHPPHGG